MGTDIRVGDCIIRPQRRLIECGAESVHVTPKAMAVLEALVAAGGAPVSRNDLFEQVWRGAEVTDDALTKCIGELRRAFGDSARESRVIETIPKLGFRLVPPITPLGDLDAEHVPSRSRGGRWPTALSLVVIMVSAVLLFSGATRQWLYEEGVGLVMQAATILSPHELEPAPAIAVLPFHNLSSDSENQYFSEGVSAEIINTLARTGRLPVIAQSSSFQFRGENKDAREIGRRLGVPYVLEGSVRKSDEDIRLTTQLIDARSGELLWSEVYQAELVDIFALQQTMSNHIVDQVYLALGLQPVALVGDITVGENRTYIPTGNLEAYDLYLKGRAMMTSDRPALIEQAPAYFDRAIALDGNFADAWAAKGYAIGMLGSLQSGSSHIPATVYPDSIAALQKALEIDPGHAAATGWLGVLLMLNDFKWAEGMQLLQQSLDLNPNDAELLSAYGFYLETMGMEGAEEVVERAYRLDPLSIETTLNLALHLSRNGRRLEAAALVETNLDRDFDGYAANVYAALFNLRIGRLERASEQLRRARAVAKPVDLNLDAIQWVVDNLRGKGPIPLEEIRARMRTEKLNDAVLYVEDLDEESVVALFELAIEQRLPAVRSALFYRQKPPAMPEADWRRFREMTGVAEFEQSLRE